MPGVVTCVGSEPDEILLPVQENVRIALGAVEANRSGRPEETVEAAVALAHPELRFTSRLSSLEGSSYRGHDGARRYFQDMTDAFAEWRNEAKNAVVVGQDAVVLDVVFRATSRSGVDVELPSAAVFVLSDGAIIEMHVYETRREALEAAGLEE